VGREKALVARATAGSGYGSGAGAGAGAGAPHALSLAHALAGGGGGASADADAILRRDALDVQQVAALRRRAAGLQHELQRLLDDE
jgi:hypothetical protein